MNQEEKSFLTKKKILDTAGILFARDGFDTTTMQDIMTESGLSKGAIYHHFKSKEDIMSALGDRMFFENNPFEAIRGRTDLNGLQKIRALLVLNQSDTKRTSINVQAVPILKDSRILASAIEANRRMLTPLWFELLEEGRMDGSIQTAYTKELSELLPLIDFWLMPSVYPDTIEGIRHKFRFVSEMLAKMGLPIWDDEHFALAEKQITDLLPQE